MPPAMSDGSKKPMSNRVKLYFISVLKQASISTVFILTFGLSRPHSFI